MHNELPGSESAGTRSAPQIGADAPAFEPEGADTDAIFALAARGDEGLLVGVANREDVNDFLDDRLTDTEWDTLISALRNHRLIMAQIGAGMIADHREASSVKERRRRPRLAFGRREPAFVGDSPSRAVVS